jgi:allantoinase
LLADARISADEIRRLTSHDVAARLRVPAKGAIAIGKDADFSLVDLNAPEVITPEALHYRHKQSPYVGRTIKGRVRRTFLRGQTIFEDDRFAHQPTGRLVRPDSAPK